MGFLFLLCIEILAVLYDIYERRIPNPLIVAGLLIGAAWQWCDKGPPGFFCFCAGAVLPLILLGILHQFRMIGAGDIKLLMVAGGFLGPRASLNCIFISILAAAAIVPAVLLKHRILLRRLQYFKDYLQHLLINREWKPYIIPGENAAYLHFSLPVLLATIVISLGGKVI